MKEWLLSKHEALSSNPSNIKKKRCEDRTQCGGLNINPSIGIGKPRVGSTLSLNVGDQECTII
jgi:hypothetical protein